MSYYYTCLTTFAYALRSSMVNTYETICFCYSKIADSKQDRDMPGP